MLILECVEPKRRKKKGVGRGGGGGGGGGGVGDGAQEARIGYCSFMRPRLRYATPCCDRVSRSGT